MNLRFFYVYIPFLIGMLVAPASGSSIDYLEDWNRSSQMIQDPATITGEVEDSSVKTRNFEKSYTPVKNESSSVNQSVRSSQCKTFSDHAESYYHKVVQKLHEYGFRGPFAKEVAQFALIRQIIEDGPGRHHSVSMVGMVPGGLNKRVVSRLGLKHNEETPEGFKLTRVTANDGQGCYAIYGEYSNVLSCVAVVMVWDEYVRGEEGYLRDAKMKQCWKDSVVLSNALHAAPDNLELNIKYYGMSDLREKAIIKCNMMYGPGGSKIIQIVKDLKGIFDQSVN